jgi:hypothetical protein
MKHGNIVNAQRNCICSYSVRNKREMKLIYYLTSITKIRSLKHYKKILNQTKCFIEAIHVVYLMVLDRVNHELPIIDHRTVSNHSSETLYNSICK